MSISARRGRCGNHDILLAQPIVGAPKNNACLISSSDASINLIRKISSDFLVIEATAIYITAAAESHP